MKRILDHRIGNASVRWYIRQISPRTYWTATDRGFIIWRMWLGRCYDVTTVA